MDDTRKEEIDWSSETVIERLKYKIGVKQIQLSISTKF